MTKLGQTKQLQANFEKAVNGYVAAFLKQFELNGYDCWWVGDRVGIGVFCFGDIYAITLDDIIYCVENNISYEEYTQHTDYYNKCQEYNLPKLNLKAWHEGAPRIPQSTFDNLDKLKLDLQEAIKNAQKDF